MTQNLDNQLDASSPEIHERRKAEHIRINLEEDVAFKRLTSGLDNYFFCLLYTSPSPRDPE